MSRSPSSHSFSSADRTEPAASFIELRRVALGADALRERALVHEAPFATGVLHVVVSRSWEEMRRIDTPRVVTTMTAIESVNWTVQRDVDKPMSDPPFLDAGFAIHESEHAVAVSIPGADPGPARLVSAGAISARPEAFYRRNALKHVSDFTTFDVT